MVSGNRVARVPVGADNYFGCSAKTGHLLYGVGGAGYYGRQSDRTPSLRIYSLKDRKETTLVEDMRGYVLSDDGSKVLVAQGPGYNLYDATPLGERSRKAVSTANLYVDLELADSCWPTTSGGRSSQFFEQREHKRLSVVVPDPAAGHEPHAHDGRHGAVPAVLPGAEKPPFPRATSVQKCFRRPNIEDVGTSRTARSSRCSATSRSATTSRGRRPLGVGAHDQGVRDRPERLWVTVFESDDETEQLWLSETRSGSDLGRHADRRCGISEKEDNFWHMGVAGPCGPTTRDLRRPRPGLRTGSGGRAGREPRALPGDLQPRLHAVRAGRAVPRRRRSAADRASTPVWVSSGSRRSCRTSRRSGTPTSSHRSWRRASRDHGSQVRGSPADDRLLQIVTDHSRSAAFLIADGVTPSNEGRGYILRRVLRRALTEARLGVTAASSPADGASRRSRCSGHVIPSSAATATGILETVRREEQRFSQTLDAGLGMLEEAVARVKTAARSPARSRSGCTTRTASRSTSRRTSPSAPGSRSMSRSFERLMTEQTDAIARGRRESEKKRAVHQVEARRRADGVPRLRPTRRRRASVVAIVRGIEPVAIASAGEEVDVVFDRTPFYPEGGGQIGDRGSSSSGDARAEVLDTQKVGAAVLHRVTRDRRRDPRRAGDRSCTSIRRQRGAPSRRTRPRTCCTTRCATSSVSTSGRWAPWSSPDACASTSRTSPPSIPTRSGGDRGDVNARVGVRRCRPRFRDELPRSDRQVPRDGVLRGEVRRRGSRRRASATTPTSSAAARTCRIPGASGS